MPAPTITVYSRPGCHLCAEAVSRLRELQPGLGFALAEVDIERDDVLHRAYLERIPVICLDGEEICELFLDERALRERLESRR